MVKTVPESIGNLPNLAFISLPDNKDLESIPESIKNLKNLTMLNLKNSNPNVKIPESLKDILEDNGAGFYSVL
jgi:Leucine-rich repeat (LRR) protein